jgi:Fic family protein
MEDVDRLKERLDALRPLPPDHVARLWPLWDKEDALHVYASNAIEGSSMDLAETLVVLQDGITIGGKKLSEHLDIVHGHKAYLLMLKFAKDRIPVTTAVIRNLHRAVVGADEDFAGQWRDHPVYIRGSRHTPPNYLKTPQLIEEMIAAYEESRATEHPIATAAKLHFDLVHIHPFADGNGRTARLLGNLELIRNGFAPILIELEDRKPYFNVLERCSMCGEPGKGDPTEFVAFVERFEKKALERYLRVLEISENIPFDQSARQVGLLTSDDVLRG